MNIALVHDWLNQSGGAEDVLSVLSEMYPMAPVYTSIYDSHKVNSIFRDVDIRTSWMNSLPYISSYHHLYLLLYPFYFGRIHLSDYDVVISNKSGFCHGINTGSYTKHICYCLTPTRYVWDIQSYLEYEDYNATLSMIIRALVKHMQTWDKKAAEEVDCFIAISSEVQNRIANYYNRESVIIYPPVNTDRFVPSKRKGSYFLVVSRLIPYKRIDLVVEACTKLQVPLKIAGEGRDLERLQAMAGDNVEFLGRVSDNVLPDLIADCKALLFPGLEDFGITPIQAMAAGRPVIAFAGGGALDYVRDGETGILVSDQTVQEFQKQIIQFDQKQYDQLSIRQFALRFDRSIFKKQISEFIESVVN